MQALRTPTLPSELTEHASSEQAVVINLVFAILQRKTGHRMHLTEHRLNDLSSGNLYKAFFKCVFIYNVAKDAVIGCMVCKVENSF